MSKCNVWTRFQSIIPSTPLIIVTITADNSDGTYTVQNEKGDSYRVRGTGYSVGNRVFIEGGKVDSVVPASLPSVATEKTV